MIDDEVVAHICASTGLPEADAARVVGDVLAYYAEPTEAFVRRRHSQLRSAGLQNPEIFVRIRSDLAGRLVAAPELSERQVRRIVYG
jgi:hypothetical protein